MRIDSDGSADAHACGSMGVPAARRTLCSTGTGGGGADRLWTPMALLLLIAVAGERAHDLMREQVDQIGWRVAGQSNAGHLPRGPEGLCEDVRLHDQPCQDL